MRTKDEVMKYFTPVGKLDPGAQQRMLRTEIAYRELATEMYDLLPDGPDKTAALRKLHESKMTCVQAITHAQVSAPAQAAKPSQEKQTNGESDSNAKKKRTA
jgi:hypothetical protein